MRLKGSGVTAHEVAVDRAGGRWVIELGGPFVRWRGGLTSADAVWRTLGRAHALRGLGERVLVLTSELPRRRTELDLALRAAGPAAMFDVIDVFDPDALERLAAYADGRDNPAARLLESRRTDARSELTRSGAAGEVDRVVDRAGAELLAHEPPAATGSIAYARWSYFELRAHSTPTTLPSTSTGPPESPDSMSASSSNPGRLVSPSM